LPTRRRRRPAETPMLQFSLWLASSGFGFEDVGVGGADVWSRCFNWPAGTGSVIDPTVFFDNVGFSFGFYIFKGHSFWGLFWTWLRWGLPVPCLKGLTFWSGFCKLAIQIVDH
jgi:hypothetical protein